MGYFELREMSYIVIRMLRGVSAHVLLPLVSIPISLLSFAIRSTAAAELVPYLASLAGLTVIEYGRYAYAQLFYSMLISGALPHHFNGLKLLSSLIVSLVVSAATLPSGKLHIVLLTFLLSLALSVGLLTYYIKKTRESCRVAVV